MASLVAGVDCSTQATKVVVVDPQTGRTLAVGRSPHVVTGERGARETDPREWWSAMRAALAQTGLAHEIGALSVAGQQHGLVVLDRHGEVLRPAILWNDVRSAGLAAELVETLGATRWAALTGSRPPASFTVCKWAWLRRHEPATAAATAAVRLPHDYLTERLTGTASTDRGDVSGTGWWSPAAASYAEEVLALPAVDLDPVRLPKVLGPTEPAGICRQAVADELGLSGQVVVGAGTGDNMAAALGLGLMVGQPAVSLGTSGTVFAVADRPTSDPSGVVAGFADASGRFLPLACTLNCTLAVDRVAGWFGLNRDDVAPSGETVVIPWFDGERTPNVPAASATITGLRHTTDPRQLLMATYEGAVVSLLDALSAIETRAGISDPEAPLILIGGGARGQTWREVVGRLSGRPLIVPDAEELVAIGAAAQATAIASSEGAIAIARRWRTTAGIQIGAVARDDQSLDRIRAARDMVASATRPDPVR